MLHVILSSHSGCIIVLYVAKAGAICVIHELCAWVSECQLIGSCQWPKPVIDYGQRPLLAGHHWWTSVDLLSQPPYASDHFNRSRTHQQLLIPSCFHMPSGTTRWAVTPTVVWGATAHPGSSNSSRTRMIHHQFDSVYFQPTCSRPPDSTILINATCTYGDSSTIHHAWSVSHKLARHQVSNVKK